MKFLIFRAIVALVFVGWAVIPLSAQAATYLYQDSQMSVVFEKDGVTIFFLEPGLSARERGIKPGEILFEGSVDRRGYLSGPTYAFKKGCLPEPYAFDVKGFTDPERFSIELTGAPPIFESGTCRVDHYSDLSSDTKLALTLATP